VSPGPVEAGSSGGRPKAARTAVEGPVGISAETRPKESEESTVVDIAPWGLVDEIILAAGGRDEQLHEAVRRAGPAAVADLLAAEVQVRCAPPDGVSDVRVVLALEFDEQLFRYLVAFKDGRMFVGPDTAEEVLAEVWYTVPDLARLLYPRREGGASTSRDVRVVTWPWTQRNGVYSAQWADGVTQREELDQEQRTALGMGRLSVLFKAVNAVVAACSSSPRSLSDLAALYGSDKWGALHFYTPRYETHFAELRYDPVRVLEIGIGGYNFESLGGESLYMWQRYFPRGLVYGLDLFAKPNVTGPRIRTVQGDQNDPEFLRQLGAQAGPFDIIIDDGSHVNEHVRTSFETLFQYLRPGGYYVVEDLHTAYWPEFGGELPPGSAATTIGLLKDLLDELHRSEYAGEDAEPLRGRPSEMSVYHNLAVLRKGISHERGIPEWIKQRADQWIHPGRSAQPEK
jgi:demethylmacrocin O-methyltransferase